MKVLAFEKPNGMVSVVVPCIRDRVCGQRPGETEDEAADRLIAKTIEDRKKHEAWLEANGVNPGYRIDECTKVILDESELPGEFKEINGKTVDVRKAWRLKSGKIDVDDTKIEMPEPAHDAVIVQALADAGVVLDLEAAKKKLK